jgi:hypothetical protein
MSAWTAAAVIMLEPGGNVTMKPGTRRKNKYAVVKISYIYYSAEKELKVNSQEVKTESIVLNIETYD